MKDKHDQKHASGHGYTYILHVCMCLRHTVYLYAGKKQIQNLCVRLHIHTGRIYAYARASSIYSICQIFAVFNIHTIYKNAS